MARTVWTPEQKAAALDLYAQHGAAEAAKATGIPSGTIKAWAHRQPALQLRQQETTRTAIVIAKERQRRTIEERRARMLELLAEIAELGAEREIDLLADPNVSLRDVVGARTRAIHDLQLLSGGVTSRSEQADPRTRVAHLKDELAERRQRSA